MNPSTDAVPRSGSSSTSMTIGPAMTRNGIVPAQNPFTAVPRVANQCAR